MQKKDIKSYPELLDNLNKSGKKFLLLFKKGSEQSDCALSRIRNLDARINATLLLADVNEVRDIHTVYNINSVPALLEFENGKLRNIFKGCHTESFYASAFTGTGFTSIKPAEGKKEKRVTVYTSPTCTWCNAVKMYLEGKGIRYAEINVAANPAMAEEMVRKSGQQGVPQTDIDGKIVVGFDKNRINELLEIH
ncbi:MAG: hypothetical protein JXR52_05285 [Bacteroidales bacterium]|nr:hypothetical protein [Bacteroidales bacterium]MBN2698219.1 hypothetical protein [Bacteroidales bacterium]